MVNTSQQTLHFSKISSLGIVDIRSLGFYNIKHETLQYNLTQIVCNTLTWILQVKEKTNQIADKSSIKQHLTADPYLWLEHDDPRRNMSDEEILCKYIDLSQSCLDQEQKEDLLALVCKYKNAFSLRDEIGECPNIKVDIDVIDESPFFVRPFPIS